MIGKFEEIKVPGLFEFYQKGIPCYVGTCDVESVSKQTGVPVKDIHPIRQADTISVTPTLAISVLDTPGHTPGSVCFKVGDILFTGDTMFVGNCGRTDFPESNAQDMKSSLKRLSMQSKNTLVCPGHNYASIPWSTIGHECKTNMSMRQAAHGG